MIEASDLIKGQKLKINLDSVEDRLPSSLYKKLSHHPYGTWLGGYKMVDGNCFGLILQFDDGTTSWFFEKELSCDTLENKIN